MTPLTLRGPYSDAESEFWYNVMPQADMPIAGKIDAEFDVDRIALFLTSAAKDSLAAFQKRVKEELLAEPTIFHDLRQLLGISDKRAYLELSFLTSRTKHPTAPTGLCGCQRWDMARHPLAFFLRLAATGSDPIRRAMVKVLAAFLLKEGLAEAAVGFAGLNSTQLAAIYKALVLPRESQQKAAKQRGHGCEGALARLLHECGVRFEPADKHENPMGAKDPNLDRQTLRIVPKKQGSTFSFDMLVLDASRVRVAIQSLIHTSDPGQYGVNKSDETVLIAEQIKNANQSRRNNRRLELWGLVDGVGFSENKADTINKMLRHFDYFVQLNTLYKAPLRLHALGLCVINAIQFSDFYSPKDVTAITTKYVPPHVTVLSARQAPKRGWKAVPAGRATIYV